MTIIANPYILYGTPVLPTDSLEVYFDFTDSDNLFQNTAGTTPVTATGQVVANASDLSGNGNDAVQNTSGWEPTYQGANGIEFDAIDDYLQLTSLLTLANFELYIVSRMKTIDSNHFFFGSTTAGNDRIKHQDGNEMRVRTSGQGSTTTVIHNLGITTAEYDVLRIARASNVVNVHRNGIAGPSPETLTDDLTLNLIARRLAGGFWDVFIKAIAIYSKAHSTAEAVQATAFLSTFV